MLEDGGGGGGGGGRAGGVGDMGVTAVAATRGYSTYIDVAAMPRPAPDAADRGGLRGCGCGTERLVARRWYGHGGDDSHSGGRWSWSRCRMRRWPRRRWQRRRRGWRWKAGAAASGDQCTSAGKDVVVLVRHHRRRLGRPEAVDSLARLVAATSLGVGVVKGLYRRRGATETC